MHLINSLLHMDPFKVNWGSCFILHLCNFPFFPKILWPPTPWKIDPPITQPSKTNVLWPSPTDFTPLPSPLPILIFPFEQSCRLEACNFIKKEIPIQVFPCEFWEIFKKPILFIYGRLLLRIRIFSVKICPKIKKTTSTIHNPYEFYLNSWRTAIKFTMSWEWIFYIFRDSSIWSKHIVRVNIVRFFRIIHSQYSR